MSLDAWTLLQLADSAFPTGGFAHSGGIEATVQLGLCRGRADLERLLHEALWGVASSSLPWLAAAHAAPDELPGLDLRCDAALPHHVANRASRVQGQAFLRAAAAAHPAAIGPLSRAAARPGAPCHLAPVFGAALSSLGAALDESRRLFLFQATRGAALAAVRLGVVGPSEAQRLLADLAPAAERVLRDTADRAPEDAAATSPLLDLVQAQQDALYSRLFQS